MEAFGLNFCHGLGLGLHERPLISRLNSLKDPIELKVGHGVRRRDLLPGERRHFRGAHRGGGDPHAVGAEDHFARIRRKSCRSPIRIDADGADAMTWMTHASDRTMIGRPVALDQRLNADDLDGLMTLYEPAAALMPMPGKVVVGTSAFARRSRASSR